jgi:FMN-dependent NADH-azoreductase
VIQRYRWRLDAAQQALSLAEMENASLQRQLTAAIDTVQAFGLHNRTIGMEAKVYADAIVKATKP